MSASSSNTVFLRLLAVALVLLVVVLQVRLWFSEDGYREVSRLRSEVEQQRAVNAQLKERNARLEADVRDLKSGNSAIEERARADLGMVEADEDFFLFGSDPDAAPAQAPQ